MKPRVMIAGAAGLLSCYLVKNAAIGDMGWCAGLILAVLWYSIEADKSAEPILLTVMFVMLYAERWGV